MGSISQEEFIDLQNELNDRFLDIIRLNKYKLNEFIKKNDLFYESLLVPINYSNNFIFVSKSNVGTIHFLFGHYILKTVTYVELRDLIINALSSYISVRIKLIQRKWIEYYYKPGGIYITKNIEYICKRTGLSK